MNTLAAIAEPQYCVTESKLREDERRTSNVQREIVLPIDPQSERRDRRRRRVYACGKNETVTTTSVANKTASRTEVAEKPRWPATLRRDFIRSNAPVKDNREDGIVVCEAPIIQKREGISKESGRNRR